MVDFMDIHCHILFGVDDGAKDITQSIEMLRAAKEANICAMVATPHISDYPFDMKKARENFLLVKDEAKKQGIKILLGFEMHCNALIDIGFEKISTYCIEGTKCLLIEFDTVLKLANDERFLYSLQREGLSVIIAHPERYQFVQHDLSIAERWVDMGCELQLDAADILRSSNKQTRKCAQSLLKRGIVQYVASDAHTKYDYSLFGQAVKQIPDFENLFGKRNTYDKWDNP